MSIPSALVRAIGTIMVCASSAAAQDSTGAGINLRFIGSSQIGVSLPLSHAILLRPSVEAFWRRSVVVTGLGTSHPKDALLALDLDCLFDMRSGSAVTPYVGLGGSFGGRWANGATDALWAARAIGGLRFGVLKRVDVFGEARLEYSAFSGAALLSLAPSPLGIIVYLRK